MRKIYQAIASCLGAIENCQKSGNAEWEVKHGERLDELVDMLPSGSGIDNGTILNRDASTSEKLVFQMDYHHMNDGGMYDGWTEHTVTVKPSLQFGISLSISGRNRNDIKDYLCETLEYALTRDEPAEVLVSAAD